MHYYKRHIGDYAKKAGHLSVLEHGVYTLLLDAYYDREQAPTRSEAVRIARARTPEELAALDAVLSDFFHEVDGRYVQDRVEEEFAKAEEQARINQANGLKGGRPRKPKGNREETEPVISGNRSGSEKNPNPLIHQPTNQKQKSTPRAASPVPKPEGLSEQVWTDWLAIRKAKRLPLTITAMAVIQTNADKCGITIAHAIQTSTENGWGGFKAAWFANLSNSNGAPHGSPRKLSAAEQTRAHAIAREHADRAQGNHAHGHADLVGADGGDLRPPLEHGLWD